MKIVDLMIPDPITITAKASIQDAIEVMKTNSIRHLPVVSREGKLVGLLTLADLKQGLIPAMVADVTLADLIIQNPIVVGPDDDIETAARLIYKHKIGGMPVVTKGRVVGILTETDILRAFIDMMGILSGSSRIDVAVGNEPKAYLRASKTINDSGGDIISVAMTQRREHGRIYAFRLAACKTGDIRKALEKEGFEVMEAMD
ncbi:MAG: CBS domain-containing protein [Desulfobacterales bacterium]|nr:CBS domain-containing protein [Desulfobacterales bacterium]